MDPILGQSAVSEQVAMCIQVGLLCVQGDPQQRPTMHRVVVILSKKPSNLEEPTRPGVPGSRYRRYRKPAALSSAAGTSAGSNLNSTFGSSFNTISATATTSVSPATATVSASSSSDVDNRGKYPVES